VPLSKISLSASFRSDGPQGPDCGARLAGWLLATRPMVARALSRWSHLILPVVLAGIGLVILIEGGAFGL
jgi:hypothetical protein